MIRNTSILWPALSAALIGATLAGCGGSGGDNAATSGTNTVASAPGATDGRAADTSANTASPGTGSTSGGSGSAGTTVKGKASAASFAGAAAVWKQVAAAKASLDGIIKARQLARVHEAAFKARDIVRALPGKSGALAGDKQKTLAAQVKNVDQLASLLDEAGDAGKLKETQENQAALSEALDIIKSLYPTGALMP